MRVSVLYMLINTCWYPFYLAFLVDVKWYLMVVLICISLTITNARHLFCHLYIFFGEMSESFAQPVDLIASAPFSPRLELSLIRRGEVAVQSGSLTFTLS